MEVYIVEGTLSAAAAGGVRGCRGYCVDRDLIDAESRFVRVRGSYLLDSAADARDWLARRLGYTPGRYILRRDRGAWVLARVADILPDSFDDPTDSEPVEFAGGFRTTSAALDAIEMLDRA